MRRAAASLGLSMPGQPQLPDLTPNPQFAVPASRERLVQARDALNQNNIATEIVADRAAAKAAVLALVPEGAEVHVALSETMRELGVTEELESSDRYRAIRPRLNQMDRTTQRREMAKLASTPDIMLGSVHGITEQGQLLIASGSGSQLAPYSSGAGTLILVAGAQKVVRDIDEGMRRIREYAYPREDARMRGLGRPGTILAQTLIMYWAPPGRVHLFLLEEPIGY
jgi:hypothetical protein